MRRSLLVTAAAVAALSAVPATADAASQAARIKKLETQVKQLNETVKILRNRNSGAQKALAMLLTEYYCTPYIAVPPDAVGAPANWSRAQNDSAGGTWFGLIWAEREFGTMKVGTTNIPCGAPFPAPSAPARAAGPTTAGSGQAVSIPKPVPAWVGGFFGQAAKG